MRSYIRILVVEDSKSFQNLIISILHNHSCWQVIGCAADGMEAIRLAKGCNPDLILLDIGLPRMDGVRVARQIREGAAGSKIIFVTQEKSREVVREAFRLGARGYILKVNLIRELIPAVEAVLDERQFVSSELIGYEATE